MINVFFPPRPGSRHVISRERSDREIFNPRVEGFLASLEMTELQQGKDYD
ncbi:MAG: hypothetical protein AB1656_02960 [Candidatus Omnitrophota bacterium]